MEGETFIPIMNKTEAIYFMDQNYFTYDGVKYSSGTQIRILKAPDTNPNVADLAYFVYYNTDSDTVWYQLAYT